MSDTKANHRIMSYCAPCNRQVYLDDSIIPESDKPIGLRVRCSKCGARGRVIISPANHNPSNQMMGPDFYGKPTSRPRPEPIVKRRRRKQCQE